MANTTNFNWETPDDTDLVKDGAAAIRTLGSAIDTSLVDLKGGTTGQVLSKATNTDMDFTWVAQDDSNAIQNAIIDAKGDLIVGTAADTPARLAIGTNGYILTADSAESAGMKWAAASGGGSGLTLIDEVPYTSATTINVNDVFSSTYTNYRILNRVSSLSGGGTMTLRFRVSGTDTSSNYYTQQAYADNTTIAAGRNSWGTDELFVNDAENAAVGSYDCMNPYGTGETQIVGFGGYRGALVRFNYGAQTDSTSFTGFTLLSNGNATGTVSVYGYAKE